MATALDRVCAEADEALADGTNILILSDRAVSPERAAIPSLLAVAGVHHHLVREGTRLQTGLVLESGEPREVHHFATLIGYGASAINPYLMFESLEAARRRGPRPRRRRLRDRPVERRQGHRQGPAQDDLEDGHLDDPVLQRRADLRGRRPRAGARRAPLHRHRVADRRHRDGRAGDRDAGAPRARLRPRHRRPAAGRRRLRVAPRRRAPHVEPGDDRAAPARGPPRRQAHIRGVFEAHQRGRRAPRDAARPAQRSASCPRTSGCPRTTSSRRARSSSASSPAR